MSDQQRQKATVYVAGLDNQVTTQTLHDAFVPFGEIVDVTLPKPELKSSTDPHRGFGYVEFSLAEDAKEAIDNMDQAELYGRVIKVNQAKTQKDSNEGLGSKTAVWEQEGYATKYNVSDEDKMALNGDEDDKPLDPMQGLEGLDVAGPKLR
ncbi:RNA-binding domain-containing protein [Polychaeton citri CBS 116435]|uniref:RNA-binding domain-containing protein n=1 Tax=Polychaeton citri CBS 116435 TaxID=1314669 RepID=A0A9P4Q4U2_9PEZI|nr:RNA-binding domain-containing protein [Polychaeton citri CBS 116435]